MAIALLPELLDDTTMPTARMATLQLVLSPIRSAEGELRVIRQEVQADQSVAAILPPGQAWLRVIWNGRVLEEAEQHARILEPGDEVLAIPQWGIPLVAVPFILLAISVALSVASYLLAPSAKPHIQSRLDEPTFSFEGIRTAIGPGGVVPVVYGRHRIGGQLLSSSVDQVYTVLDGPPVTPVLHAIDNVYGGDGLSSIFVVANNHGAVNGSHVDIGGVTGKTMTNGGWYVTVVDIHTVELNSSVGVDGRDYTGGGTLTVVDLGLGQRRVEAIATPPTLSMLLALAEGPIAGVLADTIEINGQPIGNFPSVQILTRNGTPDQTPIFELGEIRNTFTDGRVIAGDPGIVYTTSADQEVQAFILNITFPEGLYFMTAQGEKQENVSTLGYRYRVHPAGPWTSFSFFDVAASRTAPVRFGIRKEGLALNTYDIHLQWSHANHVDEGRAGWMPTLESVTEVLNNTQAYPNTALLGLRSVATDSLQGALPNITVEVLGTIMRVNEFTPVLNWSDNPAPCIMDLMTNARYGLGIPDAQIDLQGFIAYWYYCEEVIESEKRHTLNYVLDREVRAQPALMEILQGSRTLLIKSDGLWSPRPTRNQTPVQLLTAANCTNLKLTYTRDPDRINVIEGRFINEEENYESDVLTWPTVGNWPAEVRKTSLDLRGVTKPSRVMRALQFELNRRRFELLSLEVDAALDAIVLQPHDLFRFSHPLPGWGTSGRCQPGSTTGQIVLDEPVVFQGGIQYQVYVRHEDGTVEVKPTQNQAVGEARVLFMAVPLTQAPVPYTSLWAFGQASPVDTAVKIFRIVQIQYKSDTTVHLQAIVHNPSIYDEPIGEALPVITDLFNPLGPSPPITSLILTEVTRIQASGASLRVVNLSWDVAALSAGYGPYGGVSIFRRTVLESALIGQATAGAIDLGTIQDPTDQNVNYTALTQIRGHVLDYDDYTVITGSTYVYRVVPISQRGVPNNTGAREGIIHVAGPTTPDFFPGQVRNLRLKGQAVGVDTWEGRDVHVEWDPVADSPLFSQTFFVQDYLVEVWAPGQEYRLRQTAVPGGFPGATLEWTYTLEQNLEDEVRSGHSVARRDLEIWVWARTNTGRLSLDPAHIRVINPPPDMGDMIPDVTPLNGAALISWDQFVEPRDFDHYEIHLDTIDPPLGIYQEIGTGQFSGLGVSFRKVAPVNLIIGVTYYTYILPYDTFGPGIASHTASFVPVGIDLSTIDSTPPDVPTGLSLTTGTDLSDDGTIFPWIRAAWNLGGESDLAGYELQLRRSDSATPTSFRLGRVTNVLMQPLAGLTTYFVRIAAYDKIINQSAFTAEVSITTAADTTPPAAPSGLTASGHVQGIHLLWTPPGDADYLESEVWAAATNDRTAANIIGRGAWSFEHTTLPPNAIRYYWIRAFDTSGNVSTFFPALTTAGVSAQANILDNTYIASLIADKILTGTLSAVVRIATNGIVLDGVNNLITVFDANISPTFPAGVPRVYLGKLGPDSQAYGLRVFNAGSQLMWDLNDGAQSLGIAERAILAGKIAVGALQAEHLAASTLFITNVAQMGAAVIGFAQIQDAAIQNAHISDAAITTAKIADATIIAAKIADANIINAKIQDLAVSTAKIDALAVTDAKIASLTADKITTGILQAVYRIGVGNALILDGVNRFIEVIDEAGVVRVQLGQISAGATSYGLRIWNAAAQLMYDFTNGAQTQGIALNAVSESVVFSGTTVVNSTGTEVLAGTVTFPTVVTGDTVLLWVTGIGVSSDTNTLVVRLYHDTVGGTPMNSVSETMPVPATSMAVNAVQVVSGGTFTSRPYHVTVQRVGGSGTAGLSDILFIGMRLQR